MSPIGSRPSLLFVVASSFFEAKSGADVIVCSEAGEPDVQSYELLAGGCVSNSSSHRGGLPSGASWEHGGEALVSGRHVLHALGCSTQTLGNSHYTCQHIRTIIRYFLVQWRVFGIYPCASCFGVAACLILVFLSSLVGNLKPPNGIFQSPLPNCSDTLMR